MTPIDGVNPSSVNVSNAFSAARTHRVASSAKLYGGRPQQAINVEPLSSCKNLFTAPSYA